MFIGVHLVVILNLTRISSFFIVLVAGLMPQVTSNALTLLVIIHTPTISDLICTFTIGSRTNLVGRTFINF